MARMVSAGLVILLRLVLLATDYTAQVLPELGTWLSHTCEGVGPEGVLPVTWSSWDLQVG